MTGIAIGKDAFANANGGIAIGADITADAGETRIRGKSLEVAGKHPAVTGPLSSHLRLRDENGDLHELSVTTGGQVYPALTPIDVQVYTAGEHTWTKPAGAQLVYIVATGAGAGGDAGVSAMYDETGDPDADYETTAGGRGGSRGVWLVPADEFDATVAVSVASGTAGAPGGTASGAGPGGVYRAFADTPDPTSFGKYVAEEGQYRASRLVSAYQETLPFGVVAAVEDFLQGPAAEATTLDLSQFDPSTSTEHSLGAGGHGGGRYSVSPWGPYGPDLTPVRSTSGQQGIGAPLDVEDSTEPPDTTVFGGTGSGGWSPGFVAPSDSYPPPQLDGHPGGYPGGGGGGGCNVYTFTPGPARASGSGGAGADGQIIVITI